MTARHSVMPGRTWIGAQVGSRGRTYVGTHQSPRKKARTDMPNNYRYIEETKDRDGYIVPGYSAWDCEKCGREVRRYRGQSDVDCINCGACYNAGGQRLRDDWRDNPSTWDDNVSDLDGYEIASLRKEL